MVEDHRISQGAGGVEPEEITQTAQVARGGIDFVARENGAQLLIPLVDDSRLDPWERNQAAMLVAEVQGYRDYGAQLLISRANDTRLTSWERVRAAVHVAEMEEYREHGTDLLARLAEDRFLRKADRTRAATEARKLAKLQQASL